MTTAADLEVAIAEAEAAAAAAQQIADDEYRMPDERVEAARRLRWHRQLASRYRTRLAELRQKEGQNG